MKRIWTLLVFSLLYIIAGLSCDVLAESTNGLEWNNTASTANMIDIGSTISGSITETQDFNYYKFSLESAGCVTLDMTSYMRYYCIKILDFDGEEIWYTDYNEWTETVGYRRDTYHLYLEKGMYYMQINGYRHDTSGKSTGKYECGTSFLSSETNNVEDDNSFHTATNIILGNTITGQISENDNYDTFQFLLSETGCVTLDMTSYMKYYCIKLFNIDGEEIWYTDYNEWTETVGYRHDTYDLYLQKGTYYLQINGYRYNTSFKSTGKYIVDTRFNSSNVSFEEDNNSFAIANFITKNIDYTGQISINDDFDTYKFEVSSNDQIELKITSFMKYYCIIIFDIDGKEVWYSQYNEWNSNVGYREDIYDDLELSAGTYYMQINGYDYRYDTYGESMGRYVISLNTQVENSINDINSSNSEDNINSNESENNNINDTNKQDIYKPEDNNTSSDDSFGFETNVSDNNWNMDYNISSKPKAKLNRTKLVLKKGKTKRLIVKNAANRKIKWKSSKKKVATVSGNGVVKAKKKGKAVIKVKVGNRTLKCTVTVR